MLSKLLSGQGTMMQPMQQPQQGGMMGAPRMDMYGQQAGMGLGGMSGMGAGGMPPGLGELLRNLLSGGGGHDF